MRWPFNESALRTLRWEVGRGFGSTRASAGSDGPGVGAGRVVGPSFGRVGLGQTSGRVGLGSGTGWLGVGPGSGRAGLLQVGSGRVGSGSGRARAWPGFGPPKLPEAQKPHPRNLPNSPVTHRKLSSRSIIVSCFPINPVCRAQAARSVKDRPT